MPAVAVWLDLKPPEASPGSWFPPEAAGPRAAYRLHMAEVGNRKLADAPSEVVYAGSGADGARFA